MTTTAPAPTPTPTPWAPVTAPTPVLVDLFPAHVQLPDGSELSRSRLIITADPDAPERPANAYVFTDSDQGPALAYTAEAEAAAPAAPLRTAAGSVLTNRTGSLLTAGSDAPLSYAKDGGCGCGSALKSFRPFLHPYSVA